MYECDRSWFAYGIYGWADRAHKHKTWELIRKIHEESCVPMIVFGDFNEILSCDEKEGGSTRHDRDIAVFRECLDNCGLRDLGYRGSTFTWSRGISSSTIIRECLDRFVACSGWQDVFHSFDVRHFPIYRSDHAPILLHTSKPQSENCDAKLIFFSLFGYLMMIAGKLLLILRRRF